MNRLSFAIKAAVAATALGAVMVAPAATKSDINTRVDATLNTFYAQGANHRQLAGKASAILVFPRVTKAGVGVGGEYGEGALNVNGATVGYYKVTGASVGATLGAEHRSEVILFMTDAAREKFMNSDGWTVGADANVAVVKGVGGTADTETLTHPVVAFVFGEKGLMADVSLEGSKVTKLKR